MSEERRIPPSTDAEMDSRRGARGEDGKPLPVPVTSDTLKRVDEALRWHESRAKSKPA